MATECDTDLGQVQCDIEAALDEVVTAGNLEASTSFTAPTGHSAKVNNKGRIASLAKAYQAVQLIRRIEGGPAWKKTRTV